MAEELMKKTARKKKSTKKNDSIGKEDFVKKVSELPDRQEKAFLQNLKEVISGRSAVLFLLIMGFVVGVSVQVNWVQLKCENAPFFSAEPAHCRHNLLRVLLGGPIAFLLLCLIVSALRWRNSRLSLTYLTGIQLLLVPLVAVPFIQDLTLKNRVVNIVFSLYFVVLLLILRRDVGNIFRAMVGSPSLRIKSKIKNGTLRLSFVGQLSPEEAEWMKETICGLVIHLNTSRNRVIADVSKLGGYKSDYAYVFVLLAGICASRNCAVTLAGDPQLCKQIHEDMLVICQNVGQSVS
ncbi:MAG: hypothetical protein JNJ69_08420 [Leptospiraceae bacterium]|nr:hypothetical protein [Leptospiraceae bacterium]